MCDPLTILGLGLGAAGQVVSGSENAANTKRMINARNAATTAEVARQHGYQGQTGAIFDTSVGGFAPDAQAARLAGGQTDAGVLFSGNAPTMADVGTIGTNLASDYTKGAEVKKIADVFARNTERTGNLADLTGWDNYGVANRAALNDAGLNLGVINDLSRNSAQVGNLEQQVNYNNAWRPPSGLGDLLTFAGNATGFAGGGGVSPFSMPTKAAGLWNPTTASQGFVY
jgi:hypothetical protein